MDILKEIAIREKACEDYDKFLLAEITEVAQDSLTARFIEEHGEEFTDGYRYALEYVLQLIDNFEINN